MTGVRALDRKVLRDLVHLRGQFVAIGVVVAAGVATVVTTRTSYTSLLRSRAAYYAGERLADVFAHAKRVPDPVAARLGAIPGVAVVEPRVVVNVILDVPGLAEPAVGRIVSVPGAARPRLNDVHLRRGRWIAPGRRDEVVVSEAFAEADRLDVGSVVGAVINGRWQRLRVVGIGISPEYVYEIGEGGLFPDNRHFGVLWMDRDAVASAFDLVGAFNDVSLALAPGVPSRAVIPAVDRLLAPYGGLGAFDRTEQVSARFLNDEIAQNRVSGTVIPAIFLGIAAFLLNVVLARLVATQREQIAALKAFGYGSARVAFHYVKLAFAALAGGGLGGVALGLWLARLVNANYARYYRFPEFLFRTDPVAVALALGVTALAATIGAVGAVRRVVALAPAEALQPEPPPRFRPGLLERLGLDRRLPLPERIVARNLERRWGRAALSTVGVALAVGTLVLGWYMLDSIGYLGEFQFRHVLRGDVTVTFTRPLPPSAAHDLASLPGVLAVEPFRAVPVRIGSLQRSRLIALLGLPPDAELRRIVGSDERAVPAPAGGLLLTAKLADVLHVRPGDTVRVQVLEGSRRERMVPVVGVVDELLGLSAYADPATAARLAGDGDAISGASLRTDPAGTPELNRRLKRIPAVAGANSRTDALQSFEDTLKRSFTVVTLVLVGFAGGIAVAVVYNAARISLSERGRELASLRVLGFSRSEVSRMLLGEQAVITSVGIAAGLGVGYLFAAELSALYQWELFRLPLLITGATYAFAAAVTAGAAAGSAAVVARRIGRLDLVAVLKTRE